MSQTRILKKQQSIGLQVAALCWRVKDGKLQVLMITSRRTKRWILPKGWLMSGKTAPEAARIEAWEEAGVWGKPKSKPVGSYAYVKDGEGRTDDTSCIVDVYPMKLRGQKDKWPEKHQRMRRWMSPKRASKRVWEPELARILKRFNPKGN